MTARQLTVLALLGLLGCTEDNTQSLIIVQNNVPDTSGGGCLAPADVGNVYRGSGVLDVAVASYTDLPVSGYWVFPVVRNNGAFPSGSSSTSTNVFNIELTHAEVVLTDGDWHQIGAARMIPFYKLLEAGSTAGMAFEVLPLSVAMTASSPVIARVTIVGNRDGAEIRSNQMDFPITICDGCLIDDVGPCTEFTGAASYNLCNPAQDVTITCCTGVGGGTVCPAESQEAPDAGVPQGGGADAAPDA